MKRSLYVAVVLMLLLKFVMAGAHAPAINLKKRNSATILLVAFSPDGRKFVSSNGKIRDAASGEELQKLEGHVGEVRSAAFSMDGKQIVTMGEDGAVLLWDLE